MRDPGFFLVSGHGTSADPGADARDLGRHLGPFLCGRSLPSPMLPRRSRRDFLDDDGRPLPSPA
jgi:hypothetical protein